VSILQDPSLDEHLTPEHVRDVQPSALGCEDCLKIGGRWVHLRICTERGHVGCCDNSPNRHANKHFHATQHPIIRSFEPGEEWGWCYVGPFPTSAALSVSVIKQPLVDAVAAVIPSPLIPLCPLGKVFVN
jgi:hypothetical protein